MANPGDNDQASTGQEPPAGAGEPAKPATVYTVTVEKDNKGGGDQPPPVAAPPPSGAHGGDMSDQDPQEKVPPPPPPPPDNNGTVPAENQWMNRVQVPPEQPQPDAPRRRPARTVDSNPPSRQPQAVERDEPSSNEGGLTWSKLLLAVMAFVFFIFALIYWVVPYFSDDDKNTSNGQSNGQAQGTPVPTASNGNGGGPQPTTSNTTSPSPTPQGGAKNDLLTDNERLNGGPCAGSAVDRMNYYFLGQSKEDGQIKVGTWCSPELIVDANQQLAVLQTAQLMGGTQELSKLLSTIHLNRLSRRYPGKETVLVKDGRQHTLVDPLIIPINGVGTNALQDVCAQFKEHPGDKASQLQLFLWQQCQSNLAAKPVSVQNTVITVGNYVTRPEFNTEQSYTRAELKRLQDLINARGAPVPPAEVKKLLNPHSQEEAYTPTPPR